MIPRFGLDHTSATLVLGSSHSGRLRLRQTNEHQLPRLFGETP